MNTGNTKTTGFFFKFIFLPIIFACISLAASPSYGETKENTDVMLVIDSSGSMKKTDPMTLRVPAAKLFISLLSKGDRAGVISFSGKANALISLTRIGDEGENESLLKAVEQINSRGLYTNLYDALAKGLDSVLNDGRTYGKKTIILMSDGRMDLGNTEKDAKLLDRLKGELIEELKKNDVKVFTIAFTKASDTELLSEIARKTGGLYSLAENSGELRLVFSNIFEIIKTPDMVPVEKNRFTIDSSIKEITVVASKESPETKIFLKAPDGKEYSYGKKLEGINWFASHNFDMITIKKPMEGIWKILFSTDKDNKVYIITDLSLKTDFETLQVPIGESIKVRIWLEGSGRVLKENDILEKIEFSVEVVMPDKTIVRSMLFDDGTGGDWQKEDGIFVMDFKPKESGRYKISFFARAETFKREKSHFFNVFKPVINKADSITSEPVEDTEKEKPVEEKGSNSKKEPVSWFRLIIKFVILNILLIGILYLTYTFRERISDTVKSLLKNKKGNGHLS